MLLALVTALITGILVFIFCNLQVRKLTLRVVQLGDELQCFEREKAVWAKQGEMAERDKERLTSEVMALRTAHREIEMQSVRLEEQRLAIEEKAQMFKAELASMQEKVKLEIERSTRAVMDQNTEKLNRTSRENFETLLKPFDSELKELKQKIFDTYNLESRERISLKTELNFLLEAQKQMSVETMSLTRALRGDSKAQGDWGEIVLERILESSGLREGTDFVKQGQDLGLKSEEGRVRKPDIVIHLPDGRNVIVDSKVSLTSYELYSRLDECPERTLALRQFVDSVKAHISDLSRKDYQNLYGMCSPDCVLMFMPTDGSFSLAMQADANLASMAWGAKVAIVCPSLLFPTLKVIEYMWRQDKQSRNSIEIAEQAGGLYDKFCLFVDDIDKIGARVSSLDEAYQDAIAKMKNGRGNLMSRFEKLKLLGAKAKKQLALDDTQMGIELEFEATELKIIESSPDT